jgi:enolase
MAHAFRELYGVEPQPLEADDTAALDVQHRARHPRVAPTPEFLSIQHYAFDHRHPRPGDPRQPRQPTVECDVTLESGAAGRAAVPSGASTGEHEALELRDGDKGRYMGKGVLAAVRNVEEQIGPALMGMDATDQIGIDHAMLELDGTENKGKLGANAMLAVSMAAARAAARACRPAAVPLPRRPMARLAPGAADEHPERRRARDQHGRLPGVHDRPRRRRDVRRGAAHGRRGLPHAQEGARRPKLSTGGGDEGGFAPDLASDEDALKVIIEAIEKAGYAPGTQIASRSTWRRASCTRAGRTRSRRAAPARATRAA